MALYWPDKKVALDIVDDPERPPLTVFGDDWTIVRVTCKELEDVHSFRQVMERMAELVGTSCPSHGSWEQGPSAAEAKLSA